VSSSSRERSWNVASPNLSCSSVSFNPDFRGRENNQSFRGQEPPISGDSVVPARRSLIVFQPQNDLSGIPFTLSDP
jgi:hypothetical protein